MFVANSSYLDKRQTFSNFLNLGVAATKQKRRF
uniref:Uncharacterized protein n=1 Tax=Rhizophora mucronata TaxID=61149 RepID=A0A2P2JT31_RHIMU